MKKYNFFSISFGVILGCGMLIIMTAILFITGACDVQPQDRGIDVENSNWMLVGESVLIKAAPIYDNNGYWEHWQLIFENGIILNTKEWETKPYWEGKTYGIYYNQFSRKTFLEMK